MTDFAARHIGPDEAAQRHMLAGLGYSSLEELTRAALPEGTADGGAETPGRDAAEHFRRAAGHGHGEIPAGQVAPAVTGRQRP